MLLLGLGVTVVEETLPVCGVLETEKMVARSRVPPVSWSQQWECSTGVVLSASGLIPCGSLDHLNHSLLSPG